MDPETIRRCADTVVCVWDGEIYTLKSRSGPEMSPLRGPVIVFPDGKVKKYLGESVEAGVAKMVDALCTRTSEVADAMAESVVDRVMHYVEREVVTKVEYSLQGEITSRIGAKISKAIANRFEIDVRVLPEEGSGNPTSTGANG